MPKIQKQQFPEPFFLDMDRRFGSDIPISIKGKSKGPDTQTATFPINTG